MAAVDIFVHCPTTFIEGLARTCLEAMAVGIPSVVSANGGMPDAVIDGATGFVVPPGEIDGMAEAVLKLLEDEELAAQFGAGARLRIEQVFDMAQNARKLQQVLLEYAGGSGVMRIGSEQIAGGH
jgi:glycosyltransferase involved in cell wall biosynthesis